MTGKNLRRAATLVIDSNVRAAATELQDHKLLSKLSAGDMHAQDAYYHASCLTALYNRVRNLRLSKEEEHNENTTQNSLEAITLAEVVMYIKEAPRPMVFQLSYLAKMYSHLLEQLGANVPSCVNSTRLKDRLLAQIPELGAYTEGKEIKLAFTILLVTLAQPYSSPKLMTTTPRSCISVAKAAMLVRKELLAKKQTFNGTFDTHCQRSAVTTPDLLLALVNMILEGLSVMNNQR